jgi:hypothetical protein
MERTRRRKQTCQEFYEHMTALHQQTQLREMLELRARIMDLIEALPDSVLPEIEARLKEIAERCREVGEAKGT